MRCLEHRVIVAMLLTVNVAATAGAGCLSKPSVQTPVLGNYPNTSLPLSTNTTVAPDAPPANTARITVSTPTDFNGRLEGNPATGVIRVTDAHPAGTYTVTVTAFDNDGVQANKTFALTVTTPTTCNPLSFAPATFSVVGYSPDAGAVGDFNGDGHQDLAVANEGSNSVSILLGHGDGTFQAAVNYTAGSQPASVAIGDFNGDGNQDLAVANYTNLSVSILLGNGDGTFQAAVNYTVGTYPRSVVVGDFNGDGNQDLAVVNEGQVTISILLGDGAGHFSAATNFSVGGTPGSIAAGDFNSDGKQDLAVTVTNYPLSWVSILLGNGDGTFQAAVNYTVGIYPTSVAIGDFNDDGDQDLAIASPTNPGSVSILLGHGDGTFSAGNFAPGISPYALAIGDFNGDGNQDLALANYVSDNVSILLGHGDGTFGPPINFDAGNGPTSMAVGDFNGDGRQDLAVANINDDDPASVSIFLRDCALTPTSVVSRMAHGSAGNFDINLPLTGSPGIECRSTGGTNDYTIIATFGNAVTVNGNPQAQVTLGMGTVGSSGVSNGGTVTISGNTVTIPLTNVTNAQTINLTLFGVDGSGNVLIPMGVLVGDVNGNSTVNAADVAQTKSRLGQTVDATNFRSDVNANGSINAGDVAIVKQNSGTSLPP